MHLRPLLPLLCLAATATHATAQIQSLWSNPWSNYTTIDSRTWTAPTQDVEAADDFDVTGTIHRVVFSGSGCSQCLPPTVLGATVRFYAWNNGSPGTLLYRESVVAGTPGLQHAADPTTVDVRLPRPFQASGRTFVSLQLHFQGGGYWGVWASAVNSPRLSFTKVRDNLNGGGWRTPNVNPAIQQPLYADMTFELFGLPAGNHGTPPVPCVSWTELPTAIPANSTFAGLRDVKVFTPDDIWAVGDKHDPSQGTRGSLTFTMHWDGTAWTEVPSPNPAPAPGSENLMLWGIDGVASNDLWACGTWQTVVNGGWVGQQVFAMHWDGSSWTPAPGLPLPATSIGAGVTGARAFDVEAIASNDVWFVGDWLDIVSASSGQTTRPGLLMHWNGSNLQLSIVPIVTGVGHQIFQAVAATASNDVWAAGTAGVAGNLPGSAVPVLFHYDGSAWTHRPCAVPNLPGWTVNLWDVEALAPNDVWVFGYSRSPTLQVQSFLSHWNGTAWTLLPGPPGGTAAKVTSATDIHCVGDAVWHWDGATWTETYRFTGVGSPGLAAIDSMGPCLHWAVGGQVRIGQVTPFATRLDHPQFWGLFERYPSVADRAPAILRALSTPRVGTTMTVGIDDPAQALGLVPGLAFWVLAGAPANGFPAPAPLPFGGRGGSAGELFVHATTIGWVSPAANWVPGGGMVQHAVPIPVATALVGADVYTQALLVDAGRPDRAILSNGLDLHLGW